MKITAFAVIMGWSVLAGAASAVVVIPGEVTLANYSADPGNEFAPSSVSPGVMASVLGTGASVGDLEAGSALPGSVYFNPSIASPDAAQARVNGQYFEFTLSSDGTGQIFMPQELDFMAGDGGASGPRGWAVYTSLDGFTTAVASSTITAIHPSLEQVSVSLSGFGFDDQPVTFRIYEFSPAAGLGMYFDDISVSGQVVPEASTLSLAAAFSGLCLLRRRR